MSSFFTTPTLVPTGFAKMTNPDDILSKVNHILREADQTFLDMAHHRLGLYDKDLLQSFRNSFRQEAGAIAMQASEVLDKLSTSQICTDADKLMLDFVVAKAWGTYHAISRQMDTAAYEALSEPYKPKSLLQ